jgi:hypothetical protein
MVVPALLDDAMKTHDLVLNIGVGAAIGVVKDHAQGDILVHAKFAAVVVVGSRSATGIRWRVNAMGAGAGRAGSWLMIAQGLEGLSVIGPCPPHTVHCLKRFARGSHRQCKVGMAHLAEPPPVEHGSPWGVKVCTC